LESGGSDEEIEIRGVAESRIVAILKEADAALAEAASKWKPGTQELAPNFISDWRARQESNL
jgi:hypothetical protein